MAIRTMLVPLAGTRTDLTALTVALSVAEPFDAHVDAVFVDPPQDHPLILAEAAPPGLGDEMSVMLDSAANTPLDEAHGTFLTVCAAKAVPIVERAVSTNSVSARWLGGAPADLVVRAARYADLLVVGQTKGKQALRVNTVRDIALLTAGRPILLVPTTSSLRFGRRVMIGWNGRTEAVRAIPAALPFLKRADTVSVVTAKTAKTGANEGESLIDYLSWHGIKADLAILEPKGAPIGEALLNKANEIAADLLVMGGHGHSRFRELLLGGVTKYVFSHAALPVLIAH